MLGCPALIVSLAPNQVALAQGVADAGAALDLGWYAEAGSDRIVGTLRRLSPDTVTRMSNRAAEICDGCGGRPCDGRDGLLLRAMGAGAEFRAMTEG